MALITTQRWQSRRWNAAGIERLDGVPTAVLDCWGVRLRKRWLSAALAGGRSVGDGYEFDLSGKARLRWLHRPLDRLGYDWLEGGILKEQIVLDSLAGVPDPAMFDVLIELPPGVQLHYQPALTQEEIGRGAVRPAPVVGSYAVFDGQGAKVGHILRPFAETALGQRRWLDLRLEPHALGIVLRIVLDRAVLVALPPAAWPVTIDPTFGYTSIGGSSGQTGTGYHDTNPYASPATSGTASGISWYFNKHDAGTTEITCGLYTVSSGAPSVRLAVGVKGAIPNSPIGWQTATISYAVSAGTNYHYTFSRQDNCDCRYDAVGTRYYGSWTYSSGSLPNPFGSVSTLGNTISGYVLYEEPATSKARVIGGGIL